MKTIHTVFALPPRPSSPKMKNVLPVTQNGTLRLKNVWPVTAVRYGTRLLSNVLALQTSQFYQKIMNVFSVRDIGQQASNNASFVLKDLSSTLKDKLANALQKNLTLIKTMFVYLVQVFGLRQKRHVSAVLQDSSSTK